jgi:hypothetical protein
MFIVGTAGKQMDVMNNGFLSEDFHSTFGQRMKNIYENHLVSSSSEAHCRVGAQFEPWIEGGDVTSLEGAAAIVQGSRLSCKVRTQISTELKG